MPDFGTLTVTTVVMHELPLGRARELAEHGVTLSDAPIEFEDLDKSFLEARLRGVLGGSARDIVEDPRELSPSVTAIRGMLDSTADIVECSQEMAQRLRTVQAHNAPPSLLLVATASIDSTAAVVISKLDHEQGMRAERTELSDGRKTYRAQYLRDLILGEGTRVFKAAAFLLPATLSDDPLAGHVVDPQLGAGSIADYFLQFLGFHYVEQPTVLTQRLFNASQKWIRQTLKDDPELSAEYEIALLAQMQSRSTRLSPRRFATESLNLEHRDPYLAALSAAGVPPREFLKDTQLIANEIRRVKVHTARDATIYAPPSMYEDGSLKIEQVDGRRTKITLEDEVRSISGASGPKSLAPG